MPEILGNHLEEELKKEKIKILEQLDLGKAQIAEAVLVFLGLKPATEIDVYKWNEDPEEVKRKLSVSGLVVKSKELVEEGNKNVVARFAIARDRATVDKLTIAESDRDHQEYGKLMGYPDTAVSAFLNENELLPDDEYPDMKGVVFNFKLSKDHYKKEVKVLKEWSELIKKYSPDTYNELIGNTME